MTAHGGTNPNASCSRLVSRMVISSALAPARLSLAPCSPPSRTLRAASRWPAAILDRSCAQRLRELRPGRRNGSQPNRETPDQPRDWLSLPTPNSEEAIFLSSRAERSNPHPVTHCDGDCRVASLLAMTGQRRPVGGRGVRRNPGYRE